MTAPQDPNNSAERSGDDIAEGFAGPTSTARAVDAADAFTTPTALYRAHDRLIELQGSTTAGSEMVSAAEDLIRRGCPLGWLVEDYTERRECQRILSYWSVFIYRETHRDVPCDLLPFDPDKAPELDDAQFPFRFEEGYAERARQLSGWRRLLDECEQQLAEHHFVAVIGGSGSGRDVLVNRALIPLLQHGDARRSEFASSPNWRYCVCSPRENPLSSLVSAVSESPAPDPAWVKEQVGHLRDDEFALRELLDSASPEPTLLVVEQLESLLLHPDSREVQAFQDNLRTVLVEDKRKHFVVVILRRDRATHLSSFGSLEQPIRQSQVSMNFTTAELRRFVEEPSREAGLIFERGVLDRVLIDLQGEPTVLPLLRVTLRRLWDYRERNRITWESYEQAGAGRTALEHAAEESYAQFNQPQREILPQLFANFVAPEPGGTLVPCDVDRDDLDTCGSASDIETILETLENADLVRDVSGGCRKTYRLRYEALLTSWPRLMDWLDDYRRVHRRRLRLSEAARLWDTEHRAEDRLWRGTLLQEYAQSFESDPSLTKAERRFLKVSQLRESRARRRWLIVRVSLVALSLLVIASFIAALLIRQHYLNANINERMLQDALRQIQDGDYSGAVAWLSKREGEVSDGLADRVRRQVVMRYCPVPERLAFAEEATSEKEKSGGKFGDVTLLSDNKFVAVKSSHGTRQLHLFDARTLESTVLPPLPKPDAPQVESWPVNIAWAPNSQIMLLSAVDIHWSPFEGTPDSVQWSTCEAERDGQDAYFTAIQCVPAKSKEDGDLVLAVERRVDHRLGSLHVWRIKRNADQVMFQDVDEFSQLADVRSAFFKPTSDMLVVLRGEKRDVNGAVEGAQLFQVWRNAPPPDAPTEAAAWRPEPAAVWAVKAAANRRESWGWCPKATAEGEPPESWESLNSGIYCAAFHPSEEVLVTATNAGRVNFWGTSPGVWPTLEKSIDLGVRVFHVGFSTKGERLMTSGRDRTARVWDYDSLVEIVPRMHHEGSVLRSISLGPQELLTVTSDIVRRWTWREPDVRSVPADDVVTLVEEEDGVSRSSRRQALGSAAFQLDVLQFAAGKSEPERAPELRVTNLQNERTWSIRLPWESATERRITELALEESNGKTILVVAANEGSKGVVFLCDLRDNQSYQWARLQHEEAVLSFAWSADGELLATTDQHDYAKVWRLDRVVWSPSVSVNDEQSRGETAGKQETEGSPVLALELVHTSDVVHAAFSPLVRKGIYRLVTVSSDGEATLWDIRPSELNPRKAGSKAEKQPVAKLYHGARITHASWGTDGQLLVTASRDRTARIWNATNGRLVAILRHSCPVVQARFTEKLRIETRGELGSDASGKGRLEYSWNLDPTLGDCPAFIKELVQLGDNVDAEERYLQLLTSRRFVGDETRLEELKVWELCKASSGSDERATGE